MRLRAPEIPTIAEAGVPGYAVDVWYAMLAPSGVPRPTLERLNQAVAKILHSPDMTKKLAAIGLEPVAENLATTDAYIKSEIKQVGAGRRGREDHRRLRRKAPCTAVPTRSSSSAARARFLAGTDTPSDYLERCIATIEARDREVRAFVTLGLESARRAAEESTHRYRAAQTALGRRRHADRRERHHGHVRTCLRKWAIRSTKGGSRDGMPRACTRCDPAAQSSSARR